MKTKIVRIAVTLITVVMVSCAFAGCKATSDAASSLASTVSKVTNGVNSAVSSIAQ